MWSTTGQRSCLQFEESGCGPTNKFSKDKSSSSPLLCWVTREPDVLIFTWLFYFSRWYHCEQELSNFRRVCWDAPVNKICFFFSRDKTSNPLFLNHSDGRWRIFTKKCQIISFPLTVSQFPGNIFRFTVHPRIIDFRVIKKDQILSFCMMPKMISTKHCFLPTYGISVPRKISEFCSRVCSLRWCAQLLSLPLRMWTQIWKENSPFSVLLGLENIVPVWINTEEKVKGFMPDLTDCYTPHPGKYWETNHLCPDQLRQPVVCLDGMIILFDFFRYQLESTWEKFGDSPTKVLIDAWKMGHSFA